MVHTGPNNTCTTRLLLALIIYRPTAITDVARNFVGGEFKNVPIFVTIFLVVIGGDRQTTVLGGSFVGMRLGRDLPPQAPITIATSIRIEFLY